MAKSFLSNSLLASFVIAGSFACASAHAASTTTATFVTDANPTIDLLDRTSRLALENSQNPRLRSFARSEAAEQTNAANALYDWSQAQAHEAVASSDQDDGVVRTGRSVAIDTPVVAIPEQMPSVNQEDVDRLYGLTGTDFDVAYKAVQIDALNKLSVMYQEYITNSDEPTLKALASRELPKINRRLEELAHV